MLLAIPFGLVIGLIVGAVGGGGAILALPVLIYVLGEPVTLAPTASLIVVALAAAVGAGSLARQGHVCWRVALTFSAPAAAGSLLGTIASRQLSGPALIRAFVPVMLTASAATWRRAGSSQSQQERDCPPVDVRLMVRSGLGVGILTGFFGVGGGFLIVPVLTLWLGVTFRRAVATSLVIITLTGLSALASHVVAGTSLDLPIIGPLAATTVVGALTGTLVAGRLPQRELARGFAVVVALVALFLVADVLAFGGPHGC